MITKIQVFGLYDVFDHTINLKEENITLILGENGLGKTIILKMVKAFFDKNYNDLFSFPYREFRLFFNEKEVITILKEIDEEESNLIFRYRKTSDPKKNKNEFKLPISQFHRRSYYHKYPKRSINYIDFDRHSSELEYFINRNSRHYIERVGREKWVDHKFGEVYSTREIITKFKDYLPEGIIKELYTKIPDWLTNKSDLFEAMLIETQRLLYKSKEGESEYKNSVIKYAQELAEKIKNKTVAATDLASNLDKNYPNRVVEEITKKNKISDEEIKLGLNHLSKRRELLNKVGLIDTEEEQFHPLNNTIEGGQKNNDLLNIVLQVYINDSNKKLEIYDDLAKKLEILIDIINKRFLYKTLSISKTNGFVFKSTITEKEIPLSGLSSGEQHELVLFYQLLFDTLPSSLLLIDEPEISLHIKWQNHFIDDLQEVIKLNSFSAIIATHSPDIINNKWSLTVNLNGGNNERIHKSR